MPTPTSKTPPRARRSPRAARPRATASTPGCARWWPGTSTPRTARPFWLDWAKQRGLRPAQGREALRRPRPLRLLPGRVAARRAGAALGAEGLRRAADLRSSRPAAPPACRSRASTSTTSASTTRCSATRCPTTYFPKGADWLHASARAGRAGCASRSSTWPAPRRHLLHGRPRPALGDQAHQARRDGRRWSATSSTSSTRR